MSNNNNNNNNNTLLLVDVQRDFHPGGSLAIPSANDDAGRIATLIRTHGSKITRIVATLDSHHKLHIANPCFWTKGDDPSIKPSPFTIISANDIAKGVWKPNPKVRLDLDNALDDSVWGRPTKQDLMTDDGTTKFDLTQYCLEYARRLEQKGRFQICIWPEHCLIGSVGHTIVPQVRQAMDEWSELTGGSVEWVLKGQNLLTEMYSALAAEVPVSKGTAFNSRLQQSLLQSTDHLLVCGQAMSHCVNYTLRDIVEHCSSPDEISKIYLLTDCASAVPGFEAAADTFQNDMATAGVHLITSSHVDKVL